MEAEMIRAILVALALSSLVMGGAPVKAYFVDGNQLSDFCQGRSPPACYGYILGATDVLMRQHLFCMNEGIRDSQVEDVVKRFTSEITLSSDN
jgi:hypothetical protein